MNHPAKFYRAIGGAAGCRALSKAFYAQVEKDPVLRPLFPSTFKCAIEEFSAFLVQFLGGESDATQNRWWLSLRESHNRFAIGERERKAWLKAMTATLADESLIADSRVRSDLLEFFRQSSAHVVNKGQIIERPQLLNGELAPLWDAQVALEEAIALVRSQDSAKFIELAQSDILRCLFARSPAVHASLLSLASRSKNATLREYAVDQIRAHPSLVFERYSHSRTLLHDASGAGDAALVELLLELGAGNVKDDESARTPLYCVGNECSAPGGSEVVRLLLRRNPALVNTINGVKRCTALHMAARRGNAGLIEALLDCGADIEARDSSGDTSLRRAVNCNKLEAAKLLLRRGANSLSVGSKALTPASAARSTEMKELFRKF